MQFPMHFPTHPRLRVRGAPSLPLGAFRTGPAFGTPFDLLDRFFGEVPGPHRTTGALPLWNVASTEAALFVEAVVPGYTEDELEVTVEGDQLWIAGEPKASEDEGDITYHRRERARPAFRRSLTLPVTVDADRVEARLVNGVLTVELPKAPEARKRRIEVRSARS